MADTAATLHHIEPGEADRQPVVLLHAVGLDLTWWGDVVPGLRDAGYRVVGVDLPGHGLSAALAPGFSLGDIAGRVESLLDGLGGGPFHVVGHSVGGMLAQMMAVRRPDLVRTIVPTCSRSTMPDAGRLAMKARAEAVRRGGMAGTVAETLDRWFTPGFRAARPDVIDRCTKMLLGNDPAVNAGMWDAIAGLNVGERLGEVKAPCLVISGEHDASSQPDAGRAIAEAVAGPCRMVVIDGGSHMAPVEMPGRLVAEVAAFLKEHG